jgi:NlpC/P60 family putative phage cell wall peptidase
MSLAVIEQARLWLGTPFLAGASVQGHGCDCAGLIEGIAQDLGFACPTRQAVEHDILQAARTMLIEVATPSAGRIVLLAAEPGAQPLHAAIVTNTNTLIHAHWSAGVVENRFGHWFQKRVTHVFGWGAVSARFDPFPPPPSGGGAPKGRRGCWLQPSRFLKETPSQSLRDHDRIRSNPRKTGEQKPSPLTQ